MLDFIRSEWRATWTFERGPYSTAPVFYATLLSIGVFVIGFATEYQAALLMFFTYGHLMAGLSHEHMLENRRIWCRRMRQQLRERRQREARARSLRSS